MRASALRAVRKHGVLVVDDYTDTRESLVSMLETHGYEARGAASGLDALALFDSGWRPCVVVLDLCMPGMSGWELRKRMRRSRGLAAIPVVVLAADPDAGATDADRSGIREFLRKPVDGVDIFAVIEKHCGRSHDVSA